MAASDFIRNTARIVRKKGLLYIVRDGLDVKRYKPWLGGLFSCLYDLIMEKSIFPRKFGADFNKHFDILSLACREIHGLRVLDLAAGSGSAVHFLPNDNQYVGTDISAGLLRRAVENFRKAGFENPAFVVTGADDLPFEDGSFSVCLCILSLNFFEDIPKVLGEIHRVLESGGVLICSVPVPERNTRRSTIRGKLYSEAELKDLCRERGFEFQCMPVENGALLYFKAALK